MFNGSLGQILKYKAQIASLSILWIALVIYNPSNKIIMLSLPEINNKASNHQLNNEGCLCPFCQKINMTSNMVQSIFFYFDRNSEQYQPFHHKETYLDVLDELMEWDKFTRKMRFSLPEICVFFGGTPVHLITKSKDTAPIKLIRSKSRLNVFELQHFFLDGYLQHQPQITNKKREKHEFKQKMRQICIVAAKYAKNVTALMTLDQLGNMFKSKFKYMRDDLMYLQTLVGGHHSAQHMLKIDLGILQISQPEVYERAKTQAAIFAGSIKVTDAEYYPQKDEIQFQEKLRKQDRKLFLTYMSLKIIFTSSKFKENIMKECVFKWTCVYTNDFLWDIRVIKYDKSSSYWQTSGMQALEVKLKKTMSMIEFGQQSQLLQEESLSPKTKEMVKWLQKSTESEWNQMKVIRARLEKLQSQKKALMQSQKLGHTAYTNRIPRMRTVKKRESLITPQIRKSDIYN